MQAQALMPYHPPLDWQELHLKKNWTISFLVIVLHVAAVTLLTFSPSHIRAKPPVKKLLVRTISLQPKSAPKAIVKPINPQKPVKAPPAPPEEAVAPTPKVEEPPKIEAAKEEAAPPAPPKEVPQPVAKTVTKPIAPTPKAASKPVAKPTPKPQKEAAKPKPAPKPIEKPKPQKSPPKKAENTKPTQSTKPEIAKQEAAKQEAAKKEAAKKEAARQADIKRQKAKEQAERQNSLLNKALLSLDSSGQIEGKKSTLAKASSKAITSSPSSISSLAAESLVAIDAEDTASCTPGERSYYDELVRRLKLSLKLPEYGEVKLKLLISRQGAVVSLQNVKSKSKKNADYIEKAVPKLHLPPFGQNFPGEKEHTFRLTLSNELNY